MPNHEDMRRKPDRPRKPRRAVAASSEMDLRLTKEKQRPGPDPLSRGAWVRSSSGLSVISTGSSTTKPAKHRQGRLSPIPIDAHVPCAPPRGLMDLSVGQGWSEEPPKTPMYQYHDQGHRMVRQGEPDLFLVSPEIFGPQPPPPRPPKIPIDRKSPDVKPRPPSVATFMTASTKFGEIPEHRWVDRPTVPSSSQQRRLPYVIPPPLEPEQVKKKRRLFTFWKPREGESARDSQSGAF